ncbi:MAG: hypothetical protein ABI614_10995 [Planctomycetota bacterium]
MKALFSCAVLAVSLFCCIGCGGPNPSAADSEAESEKLSTSPDYEKQMMDGMSGGGSKSNK